MVAISSSGKIEIPEALHVGGFVGAPGEVQKNLRGSGAVRVVFDIVDGGRGEYGVLAEELPDWLHIMADRWGERRAVRRALFRKSMPAPGVSTRQ